MSAKDDAPNTPTASAARPARRPATLVAAVVVLCAVLGSTLAAMLAERQAPDGLPRYVASVRWTGALPAPGEWPRPPIPGEEAVLEGGTESPRLAVRSFSPESAQALALGLQRRRLSGLDGAAAARSEARARWRSSLPELDEAAPLTPAGECAALLRGRLLLVSLTDTTLGRSAAEQPTPRLERALLSRAVLEVVRLALAAQSDSLGQALTDLSYAEGAWLQALVVQPVSEPRARLEAAWARHERALAPVLAGVADALEASLPAAELEEVAAQAPARALALERLAPDPAALLFMDAPWGPAPEAMPVARTWLLVLGAGALAGALLGALLALALPRRRAPRDAPRDEGTERDAAPALRSELAWLHVVTGKDPGRLAHAALALAVEGLRRGERVLVIDAARRSRLHERFGCDARRGLGECLAGSMPLLGAVQSAGRPGFFLLAHGDPAGAARWDALSRLLEESQAHFGRVVMAVDAQVPAAAALPLGARVLEAWWAKTGPSMPRAAVALSARLGVPFSVLDLDDFPQAVLEAPAGPAAGWEEFPEEAAAEAPVPPAAGAPLQPEPVAPGPASGGCPVATAPLESTPAVTRPAPLACDLEVRERLRFLLWMRRVQAEGRDVPAGTGARG